METILWIIIAVLSMILIFCLGALWENKRMIKDIDRIFDETMKNEGEMKDE